MEDVLVPHRKARKEVEFCKSIGAKHFKTRSPKIYGVGRNYSAAMREVHDKIRRIAYFGHYQYATLDSVVALQNDALTYVYPSVTFYRTKPIGR